MASATPCRSAWRRISAERSMSARLDIPAGVGDVRGGHVVVAAIERLTYWRRVLEPAAEHLLGRAVGRLPPHPGLELGAHDLVGGLRPGPPGAPSLLRLATSPDPSRRFPV